MATRPPLPPFTRETVIQKVRLKTVGIPGILRKYPLLTQSTRDWRNQCRLPRLSVNVRQKF
jgi:nuclear transport factor 2 (NTF2) superfamily protein